MNILNIEHISKMFGEKQIFDDVSYGIQENDKIGIVGINGTGKSTFLKIIAGKMCIRDRKVLRMRFGMNDGRARTLEEVGREFDVTRERIRQIEAKALRKLRHPSRSRKLRDYLD